MKANSDSSQASLRLQSKTKVKTEFFGISKRPGSNVLISAKLGLIPVRANKKEKKKQ